MKPKGIKRFCITGIALAIAMLMLCYCSVSFNASGRTFDDVNEVPEMEYGLLLGTSPITPQGAHNYYFDNRIKAAAELFHAGKVKKVIASGGDYSGKQKNGCNELEAMRDSLVAHGVNINDIILDYEGLRTINSIVKVKEMMGIDSCIIISQEYHNQRAIWQADHYGLKAVGYNAAPSPIWRNRIKNTLREVLARPKMFLDLLFNHNSQIVNADTLSESEELLEFNEADFLRGINTVCGHDERDTIIGNFTGHGIDTLYVKTEVDYCPDDELYECVKYYTVSNNINIPKIKLWGHNKIPPKLVYEGDLDGDGKDEWGYLHTWINSQ